MHYARLREHQIYLIKGKFALNTLFLSNQPWGQVDWQSGVERWRVSCNVYFDEEIDHSSLVEEIPILEMYIEKDSIHFTEEDISFKALGFYCYSPYFGLRKFNAEDLGLNGSLLGPNGEIIGRFNILRKAETGELVTWINDSPYS